MSRRSVEDDVLAESWPFLNRQQVKEFHDAFAIFDSDYGGTITNGELKEVMKALGQQMTSRELSWMMSGMDFDGNGVVDFVEFLLLILHNMQEGDPDGELVEVFSMFDTDKSGTLQEEELRMAMKAFGERLTDEEIEDAVQLADTSGDGRVDYDEFVHYILHC